jgi:hypothetical protein
MPNITSIPAPRVPFVDDRTGLISREWYRFMLNLFTLTGSGTSDLTITDLAIAPNPVDPSTVLGSAIEQSQLASITAQYSQFLDIVGVAPVAQVQMPLFDDLTPRAELGTMAAQNAANVNITGGTIAGITFGGFPAGTVSLPSLYWTTDTATGFYRIGANNIGYSYNGTKLLDFGSELLAITGGLSVTKQITSTLATGTAPLVVASTTNVANLNASSLGGATFAAPGPIGGGTPDAGTFTSITTSGGATFHTTNTALTDGAAAAAGTLLNAPAAGNPTKWIGINDNGTTRYIPAW